MTPRREFLERASMAALGAALPWPEARQTPPRPGFIDVRRPPDAVIVQAAAGELRLAATGGQWRGDGVLLTTELSAGALRVGLSAPGTPIRRVHLRWRGELAARIVMGDAWERGYGDLEWRGLVPDRVMPWYFAAHDGRLTHAYGVRTGPAAFCYWQLDPRGVSLFADVRSGGSPLQPGERVLDLCDVVCRQGRAGESPFAALHAFCGDMCAKPRRAMQPAYGSNDWYWAYGKNSAATVLADARRIVELSPTGKNRPVAVIDDGWQPQREDRALVGEWDRGNAKFGDMAKLATDIRQAGARPGIWTRPLLAASATPDAWRLPRDRACLDPTVADARQKIVDDVSRLRAWGYELIKHDYTTFDLFGRWGFQMGTALTRDGWAFQSGTGRTTAEVIRDLYGAIREAGGDAAIIGCNTISHLSAGVFDICRVGDDTSGMEWGRTRKMGVNTLAFRGVQHGVFYEADADCVGVTTAIPWALNRQWLDLVARSGTPLFVSLAPDAVGPAETRDLREALAIAARPRSLGEPLDWTATVCPSRWRLMGQEKQYDWIGADGA
jgi:alpha-galactosidase